MFVSPLFDTWLWIVFPGSLQRRVHQKAQPLPCCWDTPRLRCMHAAALLLQGSRLGDRSKKIFPCQWKIHNRYHQRWGKETLLMGTGTTVLPSCANEQLWHLGKEAWVSLRPNPDLWEREGNSLWEILSPRAWCVLLGLRMMCRDPGTAFQGLLCKRNRIRRGRVPLWQHCQP